MGAVGLATVLMGVFNSVMAPVFDGDWLSEVDGPGERASAETDDDVLTLGHGSFLSRLSWRGRRFVRAAAVGVIAGALLISFLVRTASRHAPSLSPPRAVAGLSFRSALAPTMASECAKNRCITTAANDDDLASLRTFFGVTYAVSGQRVHDRHGVLRGLSASIRDGRGDDVQLRAISSPSAPAHWVGVAGLDGITLVTRTVLRAPEAVWLVETRAVSPLCDGVTAPLWGLAEIGANAAELNL